MVALLAMLVSLGGCAANGGVAAGDKPPAADSPAAIAALPLPDGVDAALWRQLTSALAQQVAARQSSVNAPQLPRPSELTYDPSTHELSWAYALAGDYDQDGQVTVADLVPLAQHFGEHTQPSIANGAPPPGFDYGSIQAVIDGDCNGQLGLGDLTVLGQQLGARVERYGLYASRSFADFPLTELGQTYPVVEPHGQDWTADFSGPNGIEYERRYMTPATAAPGHTGAWLQTVPLDFSTFTPAQRRSGRLSFNVNLPGYDPQWQALWLRAEAGDLTGGPSLPAMRPLPASPFGPAADYALAYDPSRQRLTWYLTELGDQDFNREVNIADLTAILNHYFEHGPWSVTDANFARDTDGDGLITLRDARAIGKYYHAGLQGYVVRGTDDPALAGLPSGGETLASVDGSVMFQSSPDTRRFYAADLSGFTDKYIWVVPVQLPGAAQFAAPPSAVLTRP